MSAYAQYGIPYIVSLPSLFSLPYSSFCTYLCVRAGSARTTVWWLMSSHTYCTERLSWLYYYTAHLTNRILPLRFFASHPAIRSGWSRQERKTTF
ncbi:hypothetical protein FKP32DRAFT_269056 [Trametes sanguinea]|nr:hypothetical protein FKP32DRAFT_269056 [Trametes sanguinea]